jgi:glycosyltransferase involved in cell wall biosynthesis
LITQNNQPIKIFYAGLLGVAQGVYELCKKIELSGLNIELHLMGDGAEKSLIEQFIRSQSKPNIFFHGMMERNSLHAFLINFDIAIVPLKTRIYGSVPSKIFEYGCLGFPILYFGGGEGENLVLDNKLGWVAEVKNYEELNKILQKINSLDYKSLEDMKKRIFNETKSIFNLDNQIKKLILLDVF